MPYYYSPLRKEYVKDTSLKKPKSKKYPSLFCDPEIIQMQGIKDHKGNLVENEYYYWTVNWFPRTEGHTMIVPKRYITAHEQESVAEIIARHELMVFVIDILKKAFHTDGVEVYNQHGTRSFSSIDHLHWHIMPVAKDDPLWSDQMLQMEKMGYYFTEEDNQTRIEMFPKEIQYAREDLQKLLADTIKDLEK